MKTIINAVLMLLVLTVVTGVAYPLAMTAVAKVFFSRKSNGSMIISGDRIIGSELIGQKFSSPKYFRSRPSAIDNNPMPSGGSNLSPDSKALHNLVMARLDTIRKYQAVKDIRSVPPDMLFASASGVDPHISPEAARFQVDRIALARHFSPEQKQELKQLVERSIEQPQLGFLGDRRINVLKLNLELDKLK